MWSKQAEAPNANMTSFRNKITNRKRKTPKPNAVQQQQQQQQQSDCDKTTNKNTKKQKPRKQNRKDKPEATATTTTPPPPGPDLIEDIRTHGDNKRQNQSRRISVDVIRSIDKNGFAPNKDDDLDGVLLRNSEGVYGAKRYSDSFVVGNDAPGINKCQPKLSRAGSGFLFDKNTSRYDKKPRKFSDLFRYGTLKASSSCDNLKFAAKIDSIDEMETERQKDAAAGGGGGKKGAKSGAVIRENSVRDKSREVQKVESSYLKRVKSKIYKNKDDNAKSSVQPRPATISEDPKSKRAKNKKNCEIQNEIQLKQPEIKRPIGLDFRLIRQTSNLERISFGPKKSSSNNGIVDLLDETEKPILPKSKSSSAINLNLLRTRRNKILEQVKSRNCKLVKNEFDFVAFRTTPNVGGNEVLGDFEEEPKKADDIVDGTVEGDAKPGQPVSRTGSDRRPDAVREEAKNQETSDGAEKREEDATNAESTSSLPASTGGNKRRGATNINRSESVKEQSEKEKRKQRRNISDPLHNTITDQIDLDPQELGTNSGSSSNSSLSSNSRFSECLSNNSSDAAIGAQATASEWDSDMEVEVDPPDWQMLVPPDDLAALHPHEKKTQDVINELFHTEKSHVRNLKVLDIVFMKPLSNKQCLKQEELNLVFPNLNELLELHVKFNNIMKSKRKENPIVRDLGDVLLGMFDGPIGDTFQRASAAFCERQQLALEFIKEKRRKDSRFENILCECEKNNLCRRLPLQGILPTQMQRLSKYPLFLERLIDTVEKSLELDADYWQTELSKLKQAHDRCKEILNRVNEAAKLAYNKARLEEIQRHLDATSEFKSYDLTKDNLVYEGEMSLQRPNKSPLPLHTLLMETAVVFLQKESDRYLLRPIQAGNSVKPFTPIINMNSLLFRIKAAKKKEDNNIFFLVNTNSENIQMFIVQVRDTNERETWLKHLTETTDTYKKSKTSSSAQEPEEETVQELPPSNQEPERAEAIETPVETPTPDMDSSGAAAKQEPDYANTEVDEGAKGDGDSTQSAETGGGVIQTKLTTDDWPLIQPSELQVMVPPVLTAESKVTSLEQIRRKDEAVRQALADKEGLVADLLSIPREDFHHIADMAGEEVHQNISPERDSTEFVLAPMYQVNQLLEAVNESLNISETDAVHATGGARPSCASNETLCRKSDHIPSVPAHKLRDIVTLLNSQLTTLLSVVKQGDVERDRLRKEVHQLREQIHEKSLLHGHQSAEADSVTTLDSLQSGDLESIEESPTENES